MSNSIFMLALFCDIIILILMGIGLYVCTQEPAYPGRTKGLAALITFAAVVFAVWRVGPFIGLMSDVEPPLWFVAVSGTSFAVVAIIGAVLFIRNTQKANRLAK